jgi:transketolase
MTDLSEKADQLRKRVLEMAMEEDYGHIAPALSCLEILVALFYEVMEPTDLFVMSKGHGALALYAVLLDRRAGTPPLRERLPGCLGRNNRLGHLCNTGSLGHGLPFAVGMALAKHTQRKPGRVFVLVGDAELEEGSCYEALQLASDLDTRNITFIVDCNGLGAMHRVDTYYLPIQKAPINGHNFGELTTALCSQAPFITCRTVKGHGVPFMEGRMEWHYRKPKTPEELSWIASYLSSETTPPASS